MACFLFLAGKKYPNERGHFIMIDKCVRCGKEILLRGDIYCNECLKEVHKTLGQETCSECYRAVPSAVVVNGKCPTCNLEKKAPESWVVMAEKLIEEAYMSEPGVTLSEDVIDKLYREADLRYKNINGCAGDCVNCQHFGVGCNGDL